MLEVRELQLVQAIGEHGSLVRAARVLGVSQPALTCSLALIERRLRGQLFERARKGAIPANLLSVAADILGRLEQFERTVAEVRSRISAEAAKLGGYAAAAATAAPALQALAGAPVWVGVALVIAVAVVPVAILLRRERAV